MALTLQLEGIVSTAKQTDRLADISQTWIKASATNKSGGLTYFATAAAFQGFVFPKVSTVSTSVVAGVCFLSSCLALCFGINNLNSNDVVALQRKMIRKALWLCAFPENEEQLYHPFHPILRGICGCISRNYSPACSAVHIRAQTPYNSTYGLYIKKSRMYRQMETVNLMLLNICLWLAIDLNKLN